MIVFTYRELKTAWKDTAAAYETVEADSRTNAHRLLLFYAVETGLKAVLLKRNGKNDSEGEFSEFQHDLNKLMDALQIGAALRLNSNISLKELKKPARQRHSNCSELNQIWRYGAKAKEPSDVQLEVKLQAILEWLYGELT